MSDKWTTTSAEKEFLRRERDILRKHRHSRDIQTDYDELLGIKLPGKNGESSEENEEDGRKRYEEL